MGLATLTLDHNRLRVHADWQELLQANGITSADALWDLAGQPVKQVVKERATCRCELRRPDGSIVEAYLKRYRPIPWREKLKNIICFKPYDFDAFHEWDALEAFLGLGLNTMLPLAAARLDDGRSCDLTLGITGYTRASELVKQLQPGDPRRAKLVLRLAEMVGRMHAAGMAHQDLYLVHFFILEQQDDTPFLIDLQRLIMQPQLALRWRVKDLAQLLFSAQQHVSAEEVRLFWQTYARFAGVDPENGRLKYLVRRKTAVIVRHDQKRQRKKAIKG